MGPTTSDCRGMASLTFVVYSLRSSLCGRFLDLLEKHLLPLDCLSPSVGRLALVGERLAGNLSVPVH
jgi:hypothetical protein